MDITRWLYLNGIPFNVSTSSEFWAIQKKYYEKYTVLSRITFHDNVAHDYRRFVISCAETLMCGIHKHQGEPFLHVMYDMVKLNNGKNYFGASVSFIVDF